MQFFLTVIPLATYAKLAIRCRVQYAAVTKSHSPEDVDNRSALHLRASCETLRWLYAQGKLWL